MSRVTIIVLAALVFTGAGFAEKQDHSELSQRIVKTSANVGAGDVVVVDGGMHTIPLMEAIAMEAQKAGGMVTMFLNSDQVIRSLFTDVPIKYLEQERTYLAEWSKQVDVWIGLPNVENLRETLGNVSEDRFAKAAEANQALTDMLNDSGVRVVIIDYPNEERATINQMDFASFEKIHWAAVNADYEAISEKGKAIQAILKGAKRVRVTSPAGTDLTFSMGNRPIFIDDGIVTKEEAGGDLLLNRFASLPGGSIFVAPTEKSAKGKVVVPKNRCRFEPLTGVTFEFKNGKMQNFSARQGAECFEETMAPYGGPKDVIASFSIGLNPALKVIEDEADYRPGDAAGMVYIGVGDNQLLSGTNKTQANYSWPIVNATVEIDGKVVVKDGKIVI